MSAKTANITARIHPDIKESAEAILEKIGIPVSVFIDMAYRQVINHNGIPEKKEDDSAISKIRYRVWIPPVLLECVRSRTWLKRKECRFCHNISL